jgi:hypothetical protein
VAVLAAGCATPALRQSTDFAKAGTDYCDSVGAFLDVYLVTRVDTNSKRALAVRDEKLGAELAAELPATLEAFDATALRAVRETGRIRSNVALLHAYFESLNALATSDAPEQGGAALKSLGEAINDVNKVTGGDAARFTPAQLSSIEKIGRMAVRAAVSSAVRQALDESKEAIAWQLVWQEQMLASLVVPVRQDYERELDRFRAERIAAPYADSSAKLGGTWVEDRRKWVQSRFHVEAFAKASAAAAQMRSVWEDLVSGHHDIHSVRLMLADLREFTGIVRAYHEAERAK